MKQPYLFIVYGAVLGKVFVFTTSPTQQDHNWLLCPLPVPLWKRTHDKKKKKKGRLLSTTRNNRQYAEINLARVIYEIIASQTTVYC